MKLNEFSILYPIWNNLKENCLIFVGYPNSEYITTTTCFSKRPIKMLYEIK